MKRTALYGAILGDIIGSPFEFRENRQKSKDFELFSEKSKFTDDTVMTIAVADAILKTGGAKDFRILLRNTVKSMLHYGKKYPHAGYGGGFRRWLQSENPKPYNSLGNGSAMRVSAAGWIFNSMFETRECARMTARPTHNHPEGVKGAMAVASAIFLARKGESKDDIKNYIEYEFGYDLSRTLDEIRPHYKFNETCPGSVPEAIIAFLESENFEDAIRNAVSLGGDTDTQAAIAGSIAEAFYGVPEDLIKKCREFLPKDFLNVIDKFNFGKGFLTDYLENDSLEEKIAEFNKIPSEKNSQKIKEEILNMLKKGYATEDFLPGFFSILEIKTDAAGNEGNYSVYFEKDGKDYEIFYTNFAEMLKGEHIGENFSIGIVEVKEIFRLFEEIFSDDEYCLAINPYGENPLFLEKNDLQEILDAFHYELWKKIQKSPYYPSEFTRKFLSNDLLTKKFFADARFIHTAASGAMGDAGVFEVWNKNFEHYYCHWTDNFDVKKFHSAFMKEEDTPYFGNPVKNGWCFHYMGCGNNFYIKAELNEAYLKKFDEGLKNGKNYPHDEDVFPVEEIMLKILSENKSAETTLENFEGDGKPKMKKTALYGAILGDIIGSPYEFDCDVDGVRKSKNFTFFKGYAKFTDDSVMTVAVAEALLGVEKNADEETVCNALIKSMQKWGRKYPYAGYGTRFCGWLEETDPKPNNSYGNGSAMRVSPVGWLYDTLERTREVARWSAQVSHNHPEGIKGAESIASAIFLARNGETKDEIKKYLETEFGYDLDRTLDEIRPTYRHDGSCQGTVPEAIIAFLESTDFEDAIRNAVSLGGDADTLTCITGSIAEAFYGVPQNLIDECRRRIDFEMCKVLDDFSNVLQKDSIDLNTVNGELLKIIDGYQNDVPNIPAGWIYLGNADSRYVLGQPGKKNLLIFGINPSTATPLQFDATMNKICKIVPKQGYDGWIMMNLHPQRSPNPNVLQPNDILLDNNLKVLDFIKKKFSINDVWCAWGDSIDNYPDLKHFFRKIYFSFDKSVRWYHYGSLTNEKNPRHPLYMSTDEKFYDFFVMRTQNKKIADETLKIIKQGFYKKDGKQINLVGENFEQIVVFSPTDSENLVKKIPAPTSENPAKISVVACDTFSACKGDKKFLAMNFANAHHPGGGFLNGANAQEEALCRESTLYKSLSSATARKMYDYNHTHHTDCSSDYMTISPNVCVFRDIEDKFLDEPFTTSVITIPAPNLNGAAENVPQEKLDEVMRNRLRKMFAVAIHHGYKNLILGAWGCGAFGHNPQRVAKYFHELLFDENLRYFFDEIIFAIYDSGKKKNLNAFTEIFS